MKEKVKVSHRRKSSKELRQSLDHPGLLVKRDSKCNRNI